ncbi:MAG: VWA domain-containing protein [Deltaproteobacteria bacterium]|nr:VWA domain-containing protein [Deltaproteobacteria bacterium]
MADKAPAGYGQGGSWGGTTTTSSSSSGNGYGGGGPASSSSGGEDEPPNAEVPQQDAGADPDAAFTCEGLEKDKPLVLYLSADDSNSMASPAHARERLNLGMGAASVRTYEFLNYYRIKYQAPPKGQLAIFAEAEPAAEAGLYDLQIGVRSFDAIKPRRPVTVTFVLDTSGSMEGQSIERERAVVKAVAKSLAKGDIVSIVTWNDQNSVVLAGHEVTGPDDADVLAAAGNLSAGGSTDLHGGLVAGYGLATKHYGEKRLNRVILVSDGGANTGITDEEIIAQHANDADKEGIYMVGVGTGPADGYNDFLMDTITDKGRGAYVYIDSVEEAEQMFVARFDETMEVAARAVQVELTLPWYFQMHKFYGEEYSENPAEVTPQHLAPSDAMVFDQILRACDPKAVDGKDPVKVHLAWQTPLTYLPMKTEISLTVGELLESGGPALHKGKAIVAYAEALKTGSPEDLKAAYDAAVAANPGGDPELDEIAALIKKHPSWQ